MTVTIIPRYRVAPGKMSAALDRFAEGKELALKHGARDVRIRRFAIGGQITGVHQALISFDSMSAYGEFSDSLNADPAYQDFLERQAQPDSPLTLIAMLQTSSIAQYGAQEFGRVALVRRWHVKPGRLDEMLDLVQQVVEASGEPTLSVVVGRIVLGGEMSGQIVTAGAVDSMATLGAYMDRLESDPELLRLQAQTFGPDSPTELLGMSVSVEVEV